MLETKLFEVRDRMTFIPVIATRARTVPSGNSDAEERERYLLARAGYGPRNDSDCVLLTTLEGRRLAQHDPYDWGGEARTIPNAHLYIQDHWDELASGEVIDVEFILGETAESKKSESTEPLWGPY